MHTPGPWKVTSEIDSSGQTHVRVGADYPEKLCNGSRSIATMTGYGFKDPVIDATNLDNARLMATAPELLLAAKNLMTHLAFMCGTGNTKYPFRPSPEGEAKLKAMQGAITRSE